MRRALGLLALLAACSGTGSPGDATSSASEVNAPGRKSVGDPTTCSPDAGVDDAGTQGDPSAVTVQWQLPAQSATVSGATTFQLAGANLTNVEIFKDGVFLARCTVAADQKTATAVVDTTQFPDGALTLTAHAWNSAPGQPYTSDADAGPLALTVSNGSTNAVAPTFSDNFDSYDANLWYRNSFDEGGDAFWTNDPAITGSVYAFSGGKLNLTLLRTPDGSGIGKPYVSGIFDTYNPPNHFAQQYGYFEVVVAVDKLIGLIYECVVLSPINFPPAFSTRIWTDADNNQRLLMFAYADGILYGADNGSGFDPSASHAYGLDWTASHIDFYVDRARVATFANPGGAFTNGDPAYTKMHVNSNFAGTPAVQDPGALPAAAHIDSYNVWPSKPF